MGMELSLLVLDYLDNHLFDDISIDSIASIFGYDKSYLMKRFKSDIGVSIKTYINQKKIMNSLSLLDDDESLLYVALNSGYNSLEYYSEMFSKVIGVSPSVYKKYLLSSCSDDEEVLINGTLTAIEEFNNRLMMYRNEYRKNSYSLTLCNNKKKCA